MSNLSSLLYSTLSLFTLLSSHLSFHQEWPTLPLQQLLRSKMLTILPAWTFKCFLFSFFFFLFSFFFFLFSFFFFLFSFFFFLFSFFFFLFSFFFFLFSFF